MTHDWKPKIGQKVWMNDEYDGKVFGEVVDYTSECVFIKWEDIDEPIQHGPADYDEIKLKTW